MKKPVDTIKAILSAELAREVRSPWKDRGIRAGVDSLHPLHRSAVVTSFASPNVLGLFEHKSIFQAIIRSLKSNLGELGVGRADGAHSILRDSGEDRIASFFGDEAGLIFNSKNQAILTLITALSTHDLVVIGPAYTALPLADACALIEAQYEEYSSLEELTEVLAKYRGFSRKLVFSEPIALITGTAIDTPSFFSTLEANDCWGLLDETASVVHSGLRGAGSAEAFPSHPNLLGRLSSAQPFLGTGLVGLSCGRELKEVLLSRSRYLQVEPPPSPAEVAALRTAIDVAEMSVGARQQLKARADHMRTIVQEQGWKVVSDLSIPSISIWQESLERGEKLKDALLQRKILVELSPAKRMLHTGSVIKINPALGHSEDEISNILNSLGVIKARTTDG